MEVGTYRVADRKSVFAEPTPVWLTYQRAVDDSIETYSSIGGRLDITVVSDERVEGSFSFAAVLYCKMAQDPSTPREDPCDVWDLDITRSPVSIVGTFVGERRPLLTEDDVPNQAATGGPDKN